MFSEALYSAGDAKGLTLILRSLYLRDESDIVDKSTPYSVIPDAASKVTPVFYSPEA